ncbi:MAG: hypothetical protein HPY66_1732 [Firmicutes bacterium]|nr:hypothetical protein [Bacillota bacterium]
MVLLYEFRSKGEKKMASVFDVAKYFLSCVDAAAGSSITHLKLQKLCYYAQAWNMVFNNEPLFDERFEAWVHGPACPDLWNKYKDNGWRNIEPIDEENSDLSVFTRPQIEALDEVWETYGQYDGKYLEDLTHQEDPWVNARRGFDPGEHCSNVISTTSMKEYYSRFVNNE